MKGTPALPKSDISVKIVTSKEPLAKPQVRIGPDQISLAKCIRAVPCVP